MNLPINLLHERADLHSKMLTLLHSNSVLQAQIFEDFRIDLENAQILRATASQYSHLLDNVFKSNDLFTLESKEDVELSLKKHYWTKVLEQSGVLAYLPLDDCEARKRDLEGRNEIPPFTQEAVLSELECYLREAKTVFAQRIDGVFKSLSGSHVTNLPQAFAKTMIIPDIKSCYVSDGGKAASIHELRVIIAILRGGYASASSISTKSTTVILEKLKSNPGKWHLIDGGHIEIKLYKKNTCHIRLSMERVHDLNAFLAFLYPNTLAPINRQVYSHVVVSDKVRPMNSCLSYDARTSLSTAKVGYGYVLNPNRRNKLREPALLRGPEYGYVLELGISCLGLSELIGLFRLISTSVTKYTDKVEVKFDYDPKDIIDELIRNGEYPEQASHQFYPSTERVKEMVADCLDVKPWHHCAEFSAGTGVLASLLPLKQTTCVEINPLNCRVLKAKGFGEVHMADFISQYKSDLRFDIVIGNPPWNNGQDKAHLIKACTQLTSKANLVYVLPASASKYIDEICQRFDLTKLLTKTFTEKYEGTGELKCLLVHLQRKH